MSKISAEGTFSEVQNVGSDINSPKDDFAYLIDTKSRGFFLLIKTEVKDMMISIHFRNKKTYL
jgi:hypothetical protein